MRGQSNSFEFRPCSISIAFAAALVVLYTATKLMVMLNKEEKNLYKEEKQTNFLLFFNFSILFCIFVLTVLVKLISKVDPMSVNLLNSMFWGYYGKLQLFFKAFFCLLGHCLPKDIWKMLTSSSWRTTIDNFNSFPCSSTSSVCPEVYVPLPIVLKGPRYT